MDINDINISKLHITDMSPDSNLSKINSHSNNDSDEKDLPVLENVSNTGTGTSIDTKCKILKNDSVSENKDNEISEIRRDNNNVLLCSSNFNDGHFKLQLSEPWLKDIPMKRRKINLAQEAQHSVYYQNLSESRKECFSRILKCLDQTQVLFNDYQQNLPNFIKWGPPITVNKKISLSDTTLLKIQSVDGNKISVSQKRISSRIEKLNSQTKISSVYDFSDSEGNQIEQVSSGEDDKIRISNKRKRQRKNRQATLSRKKNILPKLEEKHDSYQEIQEVDDLDDIIYTTATRIVKGSNTEITENSNDLKRPLSRDTSIGECIAKKSKTYDLNASISSDEDIFLDRKKPKSRSHSAPKMYSNRTKLLAKNRIQNSTTTSNAREKDVEEEIVEIPDSDVSQPSVSQNPGTEEIECIQCPLCSKDFPRNEIEAHASGCNGDSSPAPLHVSDDEIKDAPLMTRLRQRNL